MKQLLIKNIKKLVQTEKENQPYIAGAQMAQLPSIDDAYLLIKGAYINAYGSMSELDESALPTGVEVIDATDRLVLPAWCDSHTHLVYPKSRDVEYVDKIKGLSYEEIAARGGGILNSAKLMATAQRRPVV